MRWVVDPGGWVALAAVAVAAVTVGAVRWRSVRSVVLAGLVLGVAGWVAWEAFRPEGRFSNASGDGPQHGDAAALVVAVALGLPGLWFAYRQSRTAPTLAGDVEPPAATTRTNPGVGFPRLGGSGLAVRVLRVHTAIDLPDSASDDGPGLDVELPTWVKRTARGLEDDLRTRLQVAAGKGGFVVLVGNSSVGKTRLLYEVANRVLEGWPVLAPRYPGDGSRVHDLAARARELTGPGVVVWLDELHRFLPGPYLTSNHTPVTASDITELLTAPTPVIILGSLWPEHLSRLRSTKPGPDGTPQPVNPEATDVLRLAPDDNILPVETFDEAEEAAARAAGETDPRLAEATRDTQFGVTETLAGAPRLMKRYETAPDVPKALLHAAIDAQRLGVPPPLHRELLTDAARGYLPGPYPTMEQLQDALEEVSRQDGPDDHATAPLIAIHDPDHDEPVGYDVADYLLQRVSRDRRSEPIHDHTWHALTHHTTNPDTLDRLADAAWRRDQDHHAIVLTRKATDAGDTRVAQRLAVRLTARAMINELWTLFDADVLRAAMLLAEGDQVDELRARADAGDPLAEWLLLGQLFGRGELDELQAQADAGDTWTALRLVVLLEARQDREQLRREVLAGTYGAVEALRRLEAYARPGGRG